MTQLDSRHLNGRTGHPSKMKVLLSLFCLLFSSVLFAQQTVRGRVTSGDTAVANATVMVKGTTNATSTDNNGRFTINAPANATLVISSVGYESQEVAVDNRNNIDVHLQTANNLM